MRFVVFCTEEGSPAKSGFTQPAFLNFDAGLLYPPAHHMHVRCASPALQLSPEWVQFCPSSIPTPSMQRSAPLYYNMAYTASVRRLSRDQIQTRAYKVFNVASAAVCNYSC